MSTLNERAMLVTLHISAWGGMMFDKVVSEEVNESYKADRNEAGRYNKRLVAKQFLVEVGSAHSVARRTHKLHTLPWEDDGTRILSNVGYVQYQQAMQDCKRKTELAVKAFIKTLPDAIAEARSRLGTMFNEEDYPNEDELKEKFGLDIEIKNVPQATDFRVKLSDEATKAIVSDIERRCHTRLKWALNDVFERAAEKVKNLKEKLRNFQPPKGETRATGIIRESLISNMYEFAQMLDSLNVTGDPRIDELKKLLMDELVEHSPQILRTDAKVRQQVISKADSILKKVNSYLK